MNAASPLAWAQPKHRMRESPRAEPIAAAHPRNLDQPQERTVDLHELAAELGRCRLDEIAEVMRALTYGEMMEFAGACRAILIEGRKPDATLDDDAFAQMFHEWAVGRAQQTA